MTTPSADVFRNCLIIRMSESNDTIATVAGRLGCSPETVKRIRKLYRTGGINGVTRINGRRDKMGFMFDHDDVQRKAA